ncbi:MAG: PHP domain-containing protein [Bacilli bacterium]|nr:PHP domain-containing protein [Bacilli bacterium]
MKYDLHIHTTCSDGKEDKLSLLKRANDLGLDFVSFTDHNYLEEKSVENINEEYNKKFGTIQRVNLIEGIEFDVFDQKYMHILGYDIKDKTKINEQLQRMVIKNDLICQKILLNIYKHYNILYTKKEILDYFNMKYLSKRIIIDWMVLQGHAKDYIESGALFTSKKSPTYEKKLSLKLNEVLEVINSSGGVAVLAHPSTLNLSKEELERVVVGLKKIGLAGIETKNTSKTTEEEYEFFEYLAQKYNLLSTSGTDFHNYAEYPGIGVDNEISRAFVKRLGVKR